MSTTKKSTEQVPFLELLVPGCDPLYWIQSGCAGQDDP